MKILKNISLILIFIFALSYEPVHPDALATLSMPKVGGFINYYNPACLVPSSINFGTINGGSGVGTGMWSFVWGATLPYAYTPPSHPGQPVLGLASFYYVPCLVPCHTGLCPIGPGGLREKINGSGI